MESLEKLERIDVTPGCKIDVDIGEYIFLHNKSDLHVSSNIFKAQDVSPDGDIRLLGGGFNSLRYATSDECFADYTAYKAHPMHILVKKLSLLISPYSDIRLVCNDIPAATNSDTIMLRCLDSLNLMNDIICNADMEDAVSFHRSFRSVDVFKSIEGGVLDMIVHTALADAVLFWYLFEQEFGVQ